MSAQIDQAASTQRSLMNRLFISQMLQFSNAFSARGSFGGGDGEAQFASFLREEYAARLADRVQFLPEASVARGPRG
ncbi:hypothetical protein PVT71_05765 [Salipiger sp. H15]|uniref:Uncharacterized protein n=1 Tax=Alloyangia sp. H15 TaxID=3029062 RepID=A0AAU8AIR2_9RHOB